MRAKEVLMSKATTKKAQEVLQKLIDVQDDERIFLEDGTIDDFCVHGYDSWLLGKSYLQNVQGHSMEEVHAWHCLDISWRVFQHLFRSELVCVG